MPSTLHIKSYDLKVNLGWRDKERMEAQSVLLDIDIIFATQPTGCLSDHLEDTVCYADLITAINTGLNDKHYRLVEHLTYDIYQIVMKQLPAKSNLTITITKHPKIPGLIGGVSFVYTGQ